VRESRVGVLTRRAFGFGLVSSGGEPGVEMAGDVPVGCLRNVGVQLHAQACGRMSKAMLDHPRVLAGFDHQAGCDVAEAVEREALGQASADDGRLEDASRRTTGGACRRSDR